MIITYGNALSLLYRTSLNATDAYTTNELVVVDGGYEQL